MRVVRIRAPEAPERVPEGDRPAVDVDPLGSSSELAMQATAWAANASLSSTRSRSSMVDPGSLQRLAGRRDRADAHHVGVDPGSRRSRRYGRAGSSPWRLARLLGGEQQGGGAVVHRRGVAGGDRSPPGEHGAERGERLERGVGVVALVGRRSEPSPAARSVGASIGSISARNVRLAVARPAPAGGCASAKLVLVLPADAVPLGDHLGGLAEGERAVELFHPRVDQTPAEDRVDDSGAPVGNGLSGLAHHAGRAAHRLGAPGHARHHPIPRRGRAPPR